MARFVIDAVSVVEEGCCKINRQLATAEAMTGFMARMGGVVGAREDEGDEEE